MRSKGRNCALIRGRCPEDSDECPMWWKTVHENTQTGEIKVIEDCGFVQLPFYLTSVIAASNRPAAAVESIRNDMVGGLVKIATTLGNLPNGNQPKQIGDGNGV